MSKKVAIVQSNYIPWKGYFDLINSVDEFIFYDDIQYTRRDWRNRNKILTSQGLQWLTIPVKIKGKYLQNVNETVVADTKWVGKHQNALAHNYKRAQYYDKYDQCISKVYAHCRTEKYLSIINYNFIQMVNDILGIATKLTWSDKYRATGEDASERLLDICKKSGAKTYLSGPAAKDYLDVDLFRRENIGVEWMDYGGYPEYRQLHQPFEHGVTVLDLIFNEGPEANKYMKTFG